MMNSTWRRFSDNNSDATRAPVLDFASSAADALAHVKSVTEIAKSN